MAKSMTSSAWDATMSGKKAFSSTSVFKATLVHVVGKEEGASHLSSIEAAVAPVGKKSGHMRPENGTCGFDSRKVGPSPPDPGIRIVAVRRDSE